MITSAQNPKLKLTRALLGRAKERREAGAFIIEGVRLVEDAVMSHWEFQYALYDETLSERGRLQVESLRSNGVDVEEISTSLMKSLSDTESPQGIIAVLNNYQLPFTNSLNFTLIPDQVRDPGNLGTLLRSAAAAGSQAALIPPDTTDPFSPKVLRAGMGAHFRLPIRVLSWDEIEQVVKVNGLKVFLADMDGTSCWELNLRQPLALIIGGEANGASESARKMADQKIKIPMQAGVESLNAGAAGSVLMFEAARQRL
ncbi:MAG: RNA methyltransferase [Anaerolineales bacterium]